MYLARLSQPKAEADEVDVVRRQVVEYVTSLRQRHRRRGIAHIGDEPKNTVAGRTAPWRGFCNSLSHTHARTHTHTSMRRQRLRVGSKGRLNERERREARGKR